MNPTLHIAKLTRWLSEEKDLTSVINRGYDKPRFKYGIILSARIHNGIAEDFNVEDPGTVIVGVCTVEKADGVSILPSDDAKTATEKLIKGYPSLDLGHICGSSEPTTGDLESRILGTIAVKKYEGLDDEAEITGFTSFYPKLSPKLMSLMTEHVKTLGFKKLWVDVIEPHELVPYYERLGFELVSRRELKVNGAKELAGLEDGVFASRDFSMVLMSKEI